MVTWPEFTAAAPELAAAIRGLLYQYGPGLGYLATIRPDGGPRLHPVSPVITREGLFCFLVDSPKRRDLQRDGRYALHSYPPEDSDDEAYLTGRAVPVTERWRRQHVAAAYHATPAVDWQLFELTIEAAMLARYRGRSVWPPTYLVWRADTHYRSDDQRPGEHFRDPGDDQPFPHTRYADLPTMITAS